MANFSAGMTLPAMSNEESIERLFAELDAIKQAALLNASQDSRAEPGFSRESTLELGQVPSSDVNDPNNDVVKKQPSALDTSGSSRSPAPDNHDSHFSPSTKNASDSYRQSVEMSWRSIPGTAGHVAPATSVSNASDRTTPHRRLNESPKFGHLEKGFGVMQPIFSRLTSEMYADRHSSARRSNSPGIPENFRNTAVPGLELPKLPLNAHIQPRIIRVLRRSQSPPPLPDSTFVNLPGTDQRAPLTERSNNERVPYTMGTCDKPMLVRVIRRSQSPPSRHAPSSDMAYGATQNQSRDFMPRDFSPARRNEISAYDSHHPNAESSHNPTFPHDTPHDHYHSRTSSSFPPTKQSPFQDSNDISGHKDMYEAPLEDVLSINERHRAQRPEAANWMPVKNAPSSQTTASFASVRQASSQIGRNSADDKTVGQNVAYMDIFKQYETPLKKQADSYNIPDVVIEATCQPCETKAKRYLSKNPAKSVNGRCELPKAIVNLFCDSCKADIVKSHELSAYEEPSSKIFEAPLESPVMKTIPIAKDNLLPTESTSTVTEAELDRKRTSDARRILIGLELVSDSKKSRYTIPKKSNDRRSPPLRKKSYSTKPNPKAKLEESVEMEGYAPVDVVNLNVASEERLPQVDSIITNALSNAGKKAKPIYYSDDEVEAISDQLPEGDHDISIPPTLQARQVKAINPEVVARCEKGPGFTPPLQSRGNSVLPDTSVRTTQNSKVARKKRGRSKKREILGLADPASDQEFTTTFTDDDNEATYARKSMPKPPKAAKNISARVTAPAKKGRPRRKTEDEKLFLEASAFMANTLAISPTGEASQRRRNELVGSPEPESGMESTAFYTSPSEAGPSVVYANVINPEPDLINGEEYFEVDHIIEQRLHNGLLQYNVHWFGYDASYDTWEPADSIAETAPDCVNAYLKRKYPDKK